MRSGNTPAASTLKAASDPETREAILVALSRDRQQPAPFKPPRTRIPVDLPIGEPRSPSSTAGTPSCFTRGTVMQKSAKLAPGRTCLAGQLSTTPRADPTPAFSHPTLTLSAKGRNVLKSLALGVTVARLTLDQLVKVQILEGQLPSLLAPCRLSPSSATRYPRYHPRPLLAGFRQHLPPFARFCRSTAPAYAPHDKPAAVVVCNQSHSSGNSSRRSCRRSVLGLGFLTPARGSAANLPCRVNHRVNVLVAVSTACTVRAGLPWAQQIGRVGAHRVGRNVP